MGCACTKQAQADLANGMTYLTTTRHSIFTPKEVKTLVRHYRATRSNSKEPLGVWDLADQLPGHKEFAADDVLFRFILRLGDPKDPAGLGPREYIVMLQNFLIPNGPELADAFFKVLCADTSKTTSQYIDIDVMVSRYKAMEDAKNNKNATFHAFFVEHGKLVAARTDVPPGLQRNHVTLAEFREMCKRTPQILQGPLVVQEVLRKKIFNAKFWAAKRLLLGKLRRETRDEDRRQEEEMVTKLEEEGIPDGLLDPDLMQPKSPTEFTPLALPTRKPKKSRKKERPPVKKDPPAAKRKLSRNEVLRQRMEEMRASSRLGPDVSPTAAQLASVMSPTRTTGLRWTQLDLLGSGSSKRLGTPKAGGKRKGNKVSPLPKSVSFKVTTPQLTTAESKSSITSSHVLDDMLDSAGFAKAPP